MFTKSFQSDAAFENDDGEEAEQEAAKDKMSAKLDELVYNHQSKFHVSSSAAKQEEFLMQ